MELSEALEKRLQAKGWSKYQLAKKLSELDGTGRPPSSYTGRFTKVFDDPKGRTYQNIEQIINALGGRLVIQWLDITEQPIE